MMPVQMDTLATKGRVFASPVWTSILSAATVVAGCLLMALAAQVRIPVSGTGVPMTLQSLAVLLCGLSLTPPRAVAAMLLYLGCGTLGLPFFAGGLGGLLGPTGGYLIGFVVAAGVVSSLKGNGQVRFLRAVLAGLMGMVVLFAIGVGWLVVWLGGNVKLAIATGLVPFAVKTLVETLMAATLVGLWQRRPRRSPRGRT